MSGRIAKVMGQSYIDTDDGAHTKKSEIARLSKSMDVIKEAMFNRLHGLRGTFLKNQTNIVLQTQLLS